MAANNVVRTLSETVPQAPNSLQAQLHGIGWPGDMKKIALKSYRLRALGYELRRNSKEAVRAAAKALVEELR